MNCQSIGEPVDSSNEGDTITALEYNESGEYLAAGDRSGRVTVLKNVEHNTKASQKAQGNWQPYYQFQSHEPEFDFLKSLEIEAKINQIKFCNPLGNNLFILTTNDKTIKLWKLTNESNKLFVPRAVNSLQGGKLILPEVKTLNGVQKNTSSSSSSSSISSSTTHSFNDSYLSNNDSNNKISSSNSHSIKAVPKRTYANAHVYHINSLALNSDQETLVSADDLRINWWNLNISDTCFNIIDIKPENMEELTEVITAVHFHPFHCNHLLYSSSRGGIKLCDTRNSALCNKYTKVFTDTLQHSGGGNKSFITDILNSISDVNYSSDGRYLVSRDYLSVKIWDVNMESRPIKTVQLHDYLRPMLYDLYTSDTIFDKFEVCCSPDGKNFATGSYSNQLKVYHSDKRGLKTIDLPQTFDGSNHLSNGNTALDRNRLGSSSSRDKDNNQPSEIKLEEKVLHCAWHPLNNTVAVAGKTGLCLYTV